MATRPRHARRGPLKPRGWRPSFRQGRYLSAYWMILPALVLYLLFVIYPVAQGFWTSLHRWDGLSEKVWIGWRNYVFVFRDDVFWQAMGNTFKYAIIVTIVKNVLGLGLALVLNQSLRGRAFFRTMAFMPVTFAFVVIGVLWSWIYNPTFGLLNSMLTGLGLSGLIQGWLSDPNIALYSIMVVDIWKWTGFHMVLFLAGLQGIDRTYYEAAAIDGSNVWQDFRHITLPLLAQVTAVSVLLSVTGAFVSNYDLVYVMTGGGPFHSTEVALTWIVSNTFRFAAVGKANAMSMLLLAFILVFGITQLVLMTRNAYQEA